MVPEALPDHPLLQYFSQTALSEKAGQLRGKAQQALEERADFVRTLGTPVKGRKICREDLTLQGFPANSVRRTPILSSHGESLWSRSFLAGLFHAHNPTNVCIRRFRLTPTPCPNSAHLLLTRSPHRLHVVVVLLDRGPIRTCLNDGTHAGILVRAKNKLIPIRFRYCTLGEIMIVDVVRVDGQGRVG